MTREYVAAQPLRHVNLRWQGDERARQLSNSLPWRRRLPLAELARFAWELGLAFDAADEPLTSVKDTARVPADCWPGVRLRLHPSVQLRQIRNDAPQVWRAASARRKPVVAMRRPPVHSLVWREGHEPRYRAARPGRGAWARKDAACAMHEGGLRRHVRNKHATQRAAHSSRGGWKRNWFARSDNVNHSSACSDLRLLDQSRLRIRGVPAEPERAVRGQALERGAAGPHEAVFCYLPCRARGIARL